MSAKRRQETLEAFSVPIGPETLETSDVQSIQDVPMSGVHQARRSMRSSRRGEASGGEDQQQNAIPTSGDDDDDFVLEIDAESDDDANGARPRGKKGKGKGKGKANGKSKAGTRSRVAPAGDTLMNGQAISNGVNPKVMLISLKAGALGLNLTVANNIYL